MDLVSVSPIWLQRSPAELVPAQPTLSRDLHYDIVIVVFASGYEASEYLPEDVASLKSTYAFASRPFRRDQLWPSEALLWETHPEEGLYRFGR